MTGQVLNLYHVVSFEYFRTHWAFTSGIGLFWVKLANFEIVVFVLGVRFYKLCPRFRPPLKIVLNWCKSTCLMSIIFVSYNYLQMRIWNEIMPRLRCLWATSSPTRTCSLLWFLTGSTLWGWRILEDLGGSWEATTAVTPWGTSAYTATIVTIGPTFMLECLFF